MALQDARVASRMVEVVVPQRVERGVLTGAGQRGLGRAAATQDATQDKRDAYVYSAGGLGMRGGGDAGAGVGGDETGAHPSGMLWLLVADSTSP